MIVSRRKPGPPSDVVRAGIARMRRFNREHAQWVRDHPGATPDEIRKAADELAARIMPSA